MAVAGSISDEPACADCMATCQAGRDPFQEQSEQPICDTKPVDLPPDGGYGWVCVACCFLINAHTWGVNSVKIPSFRELHPTFH